MAEGIGRDVDRDAFFATKAVKREAHEKYERMMKLPPENPKPMIIKAYEAILTNKRQDERE